MLYIIELRNLSTQNAKYGLPTLLGGYKTIKPFNIKQEAFTLKRSLKKGICSSPSEMSMQNSVLHDQALLTRIGLNNA